MEWLDDTEMATSARGFIGFCFVLTLYFRSRLVTCGRTSPIFSTFTPWSTELERQINLSNSVSFLSRVGQITGDISWFVLVTSLSQIKLRSQHRRCESPRRPSWKVPRGARARWSLPCRRRAGEGIQAGRPAAESSPRHRNWYRY